MDKTDAISVWRVVQTRWWSSFGFFGSGGASLGGTGSFSRMIRSPQLSECAEILETGVWTWDRF